MTILNSPGLRIQKSRITVAKLIDHLLYDPRSGSNQFLLDHIYFGADKAIINLIKGFNDPFTALDRIVLNYIASRSLEDAVLTTEEILVRFVTAVLRQSIETLETFDRPYLLQIPGIKQDIITMLDNEPTFVRLRDLYPADDIDVAVESVSRVFNAYRTFADSVGMIDNFTLIDGSTYTLDKGIHEFLTVGSDENVDFIFAKALQSTADFADSTAKYLDKPLAHDISFADATSKYTIKDFNQAFETLSELHRDVIKGLNSQTEFGADLVSFTLLQTLADATTMIDNLDFGDQLTYSSIKDLDDIFEQTDTEYLFIGKTAETSVTEPTDALAFTADKLVFSDFFTDSKIDNIWANKTAETDEVQVSDYLTRLRPYTYLDSVTLTDISNLSFIRSKSFFDSISATDPELILFGDEEEDGDIQLLDGIDKFDVRLGKRDTAEATDYLARSIDFHLYPWQGFRHSVTESDQTLTQLGIGAGSSIYQNIPLLRTNKIYFSEQLGATYWEKTNVSVDSDAINQPELVYPDPDVLYDPSYDAANIAELFEGYQYRNPAGRAWYREAKLNRQTIAVSDADLIIEDAVTSQHYIEATVEADFVVGEQFAFGINLKKSNRRYVRITVAGEFFAVFDLNTGTVANTNAAKATVGRTGDGWYFCQLSDRIPELNITDPEEQFVLDILRNTADNPVGIRRFALLPTLRLPTITIAGIDDNLSPVYTGTGAGAFYAWGAHLETGDQVELEQSSLNYIKTVGGQASKVGFNVMPNDSDRVWVGSLLRDRSVWPNRIYNDPYEHLEYLLDKTYNHIIDPVERKELLLTKLVKTDQETTVSGTTVSAGQESEVVFVGRQEGGAYDSGDGLEQLNRLVIKESKRGYNNDPVTADPWVRTNLLSYSEDFRNSFWTKVRTISFRSFLLTSGELPYRSTEDDASQLYDLDYLKPNTYYQKRWFEIAPLSNLPAYTSNVVCDVYEQDLYGEHLVQSRVYDANMANDVFTYSVYASPVGGVSRFRLQVNNDIFADFDLSSVAVVTSSTIYFGSITTIDTSNQVYLCQIVGPAVRIRETFASQDFLDINPISDVNFGRAHSAVRTLPTVSVTMADNFILGEVVDYQTGTGAEDYMDDGFNLDFQVTPS